MAEFKMKIAGQVACVQTLFESTPQYCRAYRTEEKPDFFITVVREDLAFEQAQLDEEARLEGFRQRNFTEPFLERAAIQRAFAEHLFDLDTLLLHGSAVAVDGDGYLFIARSGTGKSTHTRLWRQALGSRAEMVNDDKPFLQITAAGVTAFGSPWSGKHGLDRNMAVPLRGICILERGIENRICRICPEEATPMLCKQAYQPLDNGKHAQFLALVNALAEKTALWRMACNQEPRAAQVAFDAMSCYRDLEAHH